MSHLHWPHWATHTVSDIEHQGNLQMMAFVLSVSMTAAAFLFAILILLLDTLAH